MIWVEKNPMIIRTKKTIKRRTHENKRIYYDLPVISLCFFAQEKTIEVTGVVTDTNKEPLVGVNVTVKDKPGLGAITDINGRYKIKIEEFSRLVFSYIGFDTQEILVKRQSLVNVSMKESEARKLMKL